MTIIQRFLATPDREAYFDFLSNIIVMEAYDGSYLHHFERAIAWEPGRPLDDSATHFRALIKHEVTHFLDMTTTAWGSVYILRKLRMLRALQDGGEEFNGAGKVFALDSSEVELHTVLVQAGEVPPASCDKIHHSLTYRDEFGVCLIVHYFKDGECHHKVPVSMLSLLEANATASEYLSLLQCAESKDDIVERRLSLEEVERKFVTLLNDHGRLEYSVLIHLTRVHFSELGLCDLLRFVASLARFSLDASAFATASMANPIQRSFENKRYGDALAMELRRDASRQLIFFKTVLFMYSWMCEMEESARAEYLALVRAEPREAILRLWMDRFGLATVDDREIQDGLALNYEEMMHELGVLRDGEIFGLSSKNNRSVLEKSSAGLLSFRDMKLLNALLNDETEIAFPNNIGIEVADYFNQNTKEFSRLDAEYRTMKHERFHMLPGSPGVRALS
ncbi:hypothetical protein [Paraburkholderia flagellata]|uniref:hypothetical protein n=1 Tax=Paraburkholderia flagellata TaxID=2883241 RepID=UPI001F47E7C9|nr:hypothetical protein [Paraburkholderia flagellata]